MAEMARVVRPGGTVALYVWDYAGEMQMMRRSWDAAVALDTNARNVDEGRRFAVCQPEALRRLVQRAGLEGAPARAIDVPTTFADFDDFWSPFLGGQGPPPAYCAALPRDQQAKLRDHLRATLPIERDGTIRLRARAFAARVTRPA